jgi:ParB family chromosome partitioning protein
MSTPRRSLGRGLGALIPGASPAPRSAPLPAVPADDPVDAPTALGSAELPVDRIRANPEQPRRVFDRAELERLAVSIAQYGILQPVVVRRAGDGDSYELVVGERRWRAAQQAGLTTIPAVIADVEPRDRLAVALVENVQRHDLNPIELALAFRALVEQGATQEEVGARVGIDRASVSNHLRLLELPRELQGDVESGTLSLGHAKALLSVASPERRRVLRDRILADGLSVRRAEEEARALGAPARAPRKSRNGVQVLDPDTARALDLLRDRLQTQVRMRGSNERGRLEIEYFGAAELQRLVERILGDA